MNIEQIQEKLNTLFGMQSVWNNGSKRLIYRSPANIELFSIQFYKNKQGEYKLFEVYGNISYLYQRAVHELNNGGHS